MNRYSNPAFKDSDDSEGGSLEDGGDPDLEDDNYLDPERDYDLINNLRRFIMNNEDDHDHDDVLVEDAHLQTQKMSNFN